MHIILAGYRLKSLTNALAFVNRRFVKQPAERRILVLNDAGLKTRVEAEASQWEILHGSNELGEFSAWQEGLDHLGRSDQAVLFANDTINNHRHYTWVRAASLRRRLHSAAGPVFVGFKVGIEGELTVAGLPFDHWVSTYSFGLSAEALDMLDHRVSDPAVARSCVPGGLDESTFFDGISPALEAHLRRWLFQGWWYAGGPLTAENASRMKRKAEAIISEKLLSARCQQCGVQTVDPFVENEAIRIADGVIRRLCRWKGQFLKNEVAAVAG